MLIYEHDFQCRSKYVQGKYFITYFARTSAKETFDRRLTESTPSQNSPSCTTFITTLIYCLRECRS